MSETNTKSDVILIGAGIMSATLGSILKELDPDMNITVFEKLDQSGEESSNEWNNAGTGHSALCELNYTPEKPDGTIDTAKAFKINEQFQVSRQFWSYLVKKGLMSHPREFLISLPHMSIVYGKENVEYLEKRYNALVDHPLFENMNYSNDPEQLKEWIPLMMKDRDVNQEIAATRIEDGTDVNFGVLTRKLFNHLENKDVKIRYKHSVDDLVQNDDGTWEVKVRNVASGNVTFHDAKFVFVGAGGGALHLIQKSGIPESRAVGGFPVSGLFLYTQNEEIVKQHYAKVYGKAPVGAPPMSVPHLDTRLIDGKEALFFGPFAGWSPKFLKTGSNADLFNSIKPNNLTTMLAGGMKNFGLTRYLISQLMLSKDKRMEQLREFVPSAKDEDWDLTTAGQRVQIIKDTDEGKGILKFGTEIISSEDGSIAALLGASPGASTAVSIMFELIETCFPERMEDWTPKLKEMVPSYGQSLKDNPELIREVKASTAEILEFNDAAKASVQ